MGVVVAGLIPRRHPRRDAILEAVKQALTAHQASLDSELAVRGVTLAVKMKQSGADVRAVVVTIESELDITHPTS
jgi:hypothetical protein